MMVVMKPSRAGARRVLPGSPFNVSVVPVPVEQYAVNDRVSHDKYGVGRVTVVENESYVQVDFGAQTVRIATPDSKLTKL